MKIIIKTNYEHAKGREGEKKDKANKGKGSGEKANQWQEGVAY